MRREWYPDGTKKFQEDLELTPTSAKLWYCGDGGVNIRDKICSITCRNEKNRPSYLEALFEQQGFEVEYRNEKKIFFNVDSESFLEWVGPAPKGFEYKWELENRERYDKLKDMSEEMNKRKYFKGIK